MEHYPGRPLTAQPEPIKLSGKMNAGRQARTSCKLAMFIVISALSIRLAYLFLFNGPTISADAKYAFIPLAHSLATDMSYAKSGRPHIKREPLYPFFLSLFFRAGDNNLWVIKITQCLLGGVLCLIIYLLAKRLFDPPVALGSAALAAIYPPLIYTNVDIATETLASLFLAGFVISWVIARETGTPRHWLLAGMLLGLTTLTRAATQFLPGLLLLSAIYSWPGKGIRQLRLTACLLAGFMLIVGGWTARNLMVGKGFVLVSANGGKSLFQGSRPEFILSGFEKYMGPQAGENKLPLKGLTEVEADRLLQRAALANLAQQARENPLRFTGFMLRKFLRLWYATSSGRWERQLLLLNGSLLILALAGLYFKWQGGRLNSISPLIIISLYFAALHTLAFPLNRYMVVVMPYVIILAANGLWGGYQYYQLVRHNQ